MSGTSVEFSKKLLEQLQNVNYELLGSRQESWLWELVFSSSENHNQFLKWILCSFDDSLEDSFKSMQFPKLSTDDQQKKLHSVCRSVGFCGENDFNIINGTADKEAIRDFWELLLDLHLSHMKSLERKSMESEEDKDVFPKNLSGISKLETSNVSDVTVSPKISDQLSNSPSAWKLLPPDLEHETREYAKANSIKSPTKEEAAELLSKIKESSYHELKLDDPQDLHDQVVLSITSLQKMVPEFTKCHQQLQPWLKEHEAKPEARNLGNLVQVASEKMAELQKMLDDLQFESKNKDLLETVVKNQKHPDVNVDGNTRLIDTLKETVNSRKRK